MFRPGEQLGPYTLVRELGQGGFGVVWLAERRTSVLTTQVAVKVPQVVGPDLAAFTREARVWLRASGHPNVLPVIEAEVYDGRPVIVSEYAAGGSLAAWQANQAGRPTPAEAVGLIAGILAGLGHLHGRGVVHRDLKPANVLLQGGLPRLTDFGLARVLRTAGRSRHGAGTPAYMSPEAWEGEQSERSDLWSVGVILYELLAGALPFPQANLMPLYRAILAGEPAPLPPAVPAALGRVVGRALAKDPADRYPSAAAMAAELRDALADPAGPDNLLHQVWGLLDPDLQDALSLAFNQARREGKDRISTRTFFAAVARLRPGPVPRLLDQLPPGALPEPVAPDVPMRSHILEEAPKLSNCVQGALEHLGPLATPRRRLTTTDIFVDVAKHGTGPSVRRLREHGVMPETIDRLVSRLGLDVARRD